MASLSQSPFLDLKNAFGLVPHQLIYDMLAHIQIPLEVRSYISSAYSQLTTRVVSYKELVNT